MPKVKVSDYVQTLLPLVVDVDEKTRQENFTGFLSLVYRNHQAGQIDQILDGLQAELDRQNETVQAIIHTDKLPKKSELKLIEQFLAKKLGVKTITWTQVDDLSSPGLIIDAGGYRFDWSLGHQLARFKQNIKEN